MVGLAILSAVIVAFVSIASILLGSFIYKRWKWKYGGLKLAWLASIDKKKKWLNDYDRARLVFDRIGSSYGFWKKGDFLGISSFMQVEVVDEPFDLNGVKVAGVTFPGQKSIKVCLKYPVNGKNVLMGNGELYDGALVHEWMHFAYEYLYNKFDYNHEREGDGLNAGTEGCWTPEHDMCIHEVMEELRAGADK